MKTIDDKDDVVVGADIDGDGNGAVVIQTRGVTRAVVSNDGTIDLAGGLRSFAKASLPASPAGRLAIVTDDTHGLWISTGTSWVPLEGGEIAPEWFGAVGDGTKDDEPALNAAIAAAAQSGGEVVLRGRVYALGQQLNGAHRNVRVRGVGRPCLKKYKDGALLLQGWGYETDSYDGWAFENVVFNAFDPSDKDRQGGSGIKLIRVRNMRFVECEFRGFSLPVDLYSARDIRFIDCAFFGTVAGAMKSGENANALHTSGVRVGRLVEDVVVERCRFHFCRSGISGSADFDYPARGLRIINCRFRGDWWNGPYVLKRFTPTGFDPATLTLTLSSGGLRALFLGQFDSKNFEPERDYLYLACPVPISSGTEFTLGGADDGYGLAVSASFGDVHVGDCIETEDGQRAEIAVVISNSLVKVHGWESADTFEPTNPPKVTDPNTDPQKVKQKWELVRVYSAPVTLVLLEGSPQDTQLKMPHYAPINVFDGTQLTGTELAAAMARGVRLLAKTFYAGLHVHAAHSDLEVIGCTFRGSWGDQCSIVNSPAPRVIANSFFYGQDEGVTITNCPGAVVSGNTFRMSGASGVAAWSPSAIISGNSFDSWGMINRNVGAVDSRGTNNVIVGNSFVAHTGASWYAISMFDPAAGTVISANTDAGAKKFTLYLGDGTIGYFQAHDVKSIGGVLPDHAQNTVVTSTALRARSASEVEPAINAPTVSFFSSYWDGTSQTDRMDLRAARLYTGAGGYAFQFTDQFGTVPLALAGNGGQVSVGYPFASPLLLGRGQLSVAVLAPTTPGIGVHGAVGQTADLLALKDSADNKLTHVGADGRVYSRVPDSAPLDASLEKGQLTMYVDEASGKLRVRVRLSDGSYRTGEVSLT